MADPKAPDGGTHENLRKLLGGFGLMAPLSVGQLRDILVSQGLAIVTEADRKVLEACAAFPDEVLNQSEPIPSRLRGAVSDASYNWCEAELEARKTREK